MRPAASGHNSNKMRIFCICLVKNEDDVLEEVVRVAATWADGIFIADNQSTDGTQAVISRLVDALPNVFDVGPMNEPFSDDLRAKVFHRAKGISARGDWWCRLDADELYIDDPREFLESLPPQTDTVWSSHFQFQFTDVDLKNFEHDPAAFLATPLRERFRFYRNDASEIRFVKHTVPFIWYRQWPRFRCASYPKRIRLAHFQYRSPEQIIRRLAARREIAHRTGGGLFSHEMERATHLGNGEMAPTGQCDRASRNNIDYHERIVPAAGLDQYTGQGYVEREADLPVIRDIWPPSIPFGLWKPYCIVTSLLSIRRLIPARIARLFAQSQARSP